MRPVISYNDIATEPTPEFQSPPTKKRRKEYNRGNQRHRGNSHRMQYNDEEDRSSSEKKPQMNYGIKEESRHLAHEEIWDDSALIEAWEAAAEEYEVLNGPEKKWKTEPVRKSALSWYNIPPQRKEAPSTSGSSFMPSIPPEFASHFQDDDEEEDQDQENSKPIDFYSFIPQHNPALSPAQKSEKISLNGHMPNWNSLPTSPIDASTSITQDLAFRQAMGAWYWAGYWTAIYNTTQKKEAGTSVDVDAGSDEAEGDKNEKKDAEDPDEFLPT